jgi:membrane-bound lytic murein transglycosylase D
MQACPQGKAGGLYKPTRHGTYMAYSTERGTLFSFPFLAAFIVSFFILAGCTKQPVETARLGSDIYTPIDAPDETVEKPYKPIDDGQPLTKAELAAFESTGELDRNLSQDEKEMVELHFKFYVHKHRKTVERFLKRSELYWPYVTWVFREKGLPEELACLVFVESGFNPNAVSWAGAGGMWQFMPYTSKKYGLYQDSWLDERRDPYKATEAAAAYLAKLHEFFDGDWHLAIAAYNAGEGKMQRALNGTDSKTFFDICRKNDMLDAKAQLKEETQQYLPRFLAFTKIIRNLESLGFTRPDSKNAMETAALEMPAGVDMMQFAREIKVDWEQFRGLNPAYLRAISPPSTQTMVRVPMKREREATAWLQQKNIGIYAGWHDYRVRRGDSLGAIAHRTGANTALLRKVNNRRSNSLKIGEYLLVPGSARAARSTIQKLGLEDAPFIARTRDGRPAGGYSVGHRIASGDTLYALSLAWGTTVDDICLLNDIEPSARLKLGQTLYIPSGKNMALASRGPVENTPAAKAEVSRVSEARSGKKGMYVAVQAGDTLFGIAQANGVTVADICRANNITPRTRLQVGQELYVQSGASKAPVPSAPSVAAKKNPQQPAAKPMGTASAAAKSVVIQSGDTLYSLARANNTSVSAIIKLNRLDPKKPLKLSQVVQLP